MNIKHLLAIGLVGSICAIAAADYDFYSATQYPGAKLKSGVDVYKVVQAGKGDPKAYELRQVTWWPRKGVDMIDVKPGMPMRTWTPRRAHVSVGAKPFKAHLYAFRGMGNTMSSKFNGDGGPWEPGVVLRLADGRKRCFVRGSFDGEDKKFIMDLYVKEMKRIAAGLDKTPYVKSPGLDARWPDNAKPGKPGTMQIESPHFIWVSGSQAGSEGDPWVNDKAPDKAQWYRDGSIKCAEYWWDLNEYAGNLMEYWDRKEKFKHAITVAGTKRDGHQFIEGYAGGGYGACILKGAGGGPWAPGLWHEWGHGTLPNGVPLGGGEAQADMHQCMADPSMLKGNHHIKTPWRNVFNGDGGYGYTMFYNITGDDPHWGYAWFTCLPHGVDEFSMLQTVARVGQQRGLFKNGIRGLGDMVGEYGARLATFDCELENLFTSRYKAPARNTLEPVDSKAGVYRIPFEEAPEAFGVNIVKLVVDKGAREFTVDFRGVHDPDFYSDWRACIVAVGADGVRRYSPMWNKGAMKMKTRAGDKAYWLTVTATPTALFTDRSLARNHYSGRHAPRYPWSIKLTGATPGELRPRAAGPVKRLGEETLHKFGLWANYAMDRPENTLLEDWYRFPSGSDRRYGRRLGVNLDGYLYGRPEFVVDGEHRGFSFDGKTQYGELCPRAADLEAIIVQVIARSEGAGGRTIFDFGSDSDNCFVLKTAQNGKPELVVKVGGKTVVSLTGAGPLEKDKWATLRVEIDGVNTSLWRDGRKVAEKQSTFRPRDAFGGGTDKRNFVATSRDGTGRFKGALDRVVIYHKVHGDFSKLPAPTRDAPRRPTAEVVKTLAKARGNVDELNRKISEMSRKLSEPYNKFRTEQDARARELEKRSPLLAAAEVKLKAIEDKMSKKKNDLGAAFDKLPDSVKTRTEIDVLRKQSSAIRTQLRELLNERIKADKELATINAQRKDAEEKRRALDKKLRDQFEKQPDVIAEREAISAQRKLKDAGARKKASERDRALNKRWSDYRNGNAAYGALSRIPRELHDKYRKRERALSDELNKANPKLADKQRQLDKLAGEKDRRLRDNRSAYMSKGTAAMVLQVAAARTELSHAKHKAMAPYSPEKLWLDSFAYQAYRGYYNTNYSRYISEHVKVQFGGATQREDIGLVERLQKCEASGRGWSATIDWDWRMKQEVSGEIKDLPLQQKWILRARGPVVTKKPASVK
ncbi:MAG: DUF6055 domain-containing protein [Phycisphaerae bacterium]|jgi:hypothetical protein|nr:DUF6055 domain-containing protein [Phycisphaerae bacterium]